MITWVIPHSTLRTYIVQWYFSLYLVVVYMTTIFHIRVIFFTYNNTGSAYLEAYTN
jgi:hypothetical protein